MSDTADLIFQVAKANVEASQVAFQSGWDAGYRKGYAEGEHAGYMKAMAEAKAMIIANGKEQAK